MIVLPSDEKVQAIAAKAFKDNATAGDLLGTAEQRMAYAVMLHHLALIQKDVAMENLSDFTRTKAAMDQISGHMYEFFLDEATYKPGDFGDAVSSEKDTRSKRQALVRKAMSLASLLMLRGVMHSDFDETSGCFFVPAISLVNEKEKEQAYGRLQRAVADGQRILLNNKPLTVQTVNRRGDETGRPIRSSVARFRQVNAVTKARASNAGKSKAVDFTKVSPTALAGLSGFSAKLATLTLGVMLFGDDGNETGGWVREDRTPEEWAVLNKIRVHLDELDAAERKAETASKAA
jgi:hypothetical protein